MSGRRIPCAVAAGVVALVAFGGAAAAGEPLTKAQLVQAADTICGDTTTKTYTIAVDVFGVDSAGGTPTVDEMTAFVTRAKPVLEDEIDDLRALDEPRRDRKRVKKILDTFEEELADFAADPSAAVAASPFDDYSRLASEYGFQVCGTEAG